MSSSVSNILLPFSYKNGNLYCENVEIDTIFTDNEKQRFYNIPGYDKPISIDEPPTPAFVYSLSGICQNVNNYLEAMKSCGLSAKIGYAIKANPNLQLVQKMKEFGVEMLIAVSGYEILAGLKAGFAPGQIVFNGNGKQTWEIKLAIEHGVLMNIDSLFDAQRIPEIHEAMKSNNEVKVFLRIRPNKSSDPQLQLTVHEYVNTAEKSKFGFPFSELDQVLKALRSNEKIKIIGVHCHFGSGINNPKIYEWLGSTITEIRGEVSKRGVEIQVVNVGGGIGIDYYEKPSGFVECLNESSTEVRSSYEELTQSSPQTNKIPAISSFLSALASTVPKDVDIIIEPGRSLIGKAAILVCNVLGTKISNDRKIMVVDGSMNEIIRPCLYGAHHEICPTKIHPEEKWEKYDIVGPICESSDFIGKQIPMQCKTSYVAVMDAGAYCSSMSSVYNLKPRAPEILVNDNEWTYIRNRDTLQEIVDKWYPT